MIDQLWAGWRRSFIEDTDGGRKVESCVLCALGADENDENFVLHRGKHNYVVLNAYPYAPGHMMVVPYQHAGDVLELDDEVYQESMDLLRSCLRALRGAYDPEGFNVGANLGRAGGAAFDDHLHFHAVPRWMGDTNFMTAVASMRVIPESLSATHARLKGLFP
ncbi:MAG: HIT domain-containing protein [Actinomycetota bacterium]|nr:HIT domain-containing protein [Actinomycetota bacterium]MDA8397027.1 HIT domain-containing protein [Actinomycetota bacterium]